MALEGTHIRFALDIKDKYKVKDLEKYISGAIYPDSRYITKIERTLTHNEDILNPSFAKDDFKKGWQAHQLCDNIQREIYKNSIPFFKNFREWGVTEAEWVSYTAAKIIQDIFDIKAFDLEKYIKFWEYAKNPNGEDIKKVKRYNQIMVSLYKGKKEVSVDEYIQMWFDLGVNASLGESVRLKTKEFLKDANLVDIIKSCYEKMLSKLELYE